MCEEKHTVVLEKSSYQHNKAHQRNTHNKIITQSLTLSLRTISDRPPASTIIVIID